VSVAWSAASSGGNPRCATLCYMEARQVGVRELRQNLSKYLDRIKRGERLEVTEHGRSRCSFRSVRRRGGSIV
jgi:hypothetical protein